MRKSKAAATLEDQPGYYIRRLQQIAVAIFLEETQAHGIPGRGCPGLGTGRTHPVDPVA